LTVCDAASAQQTSFSCTGTILELGLGQDGSVNVRLTGDNDIHGICSTETQMAGGLPASTCKAAYATLVASRVAQTPVRIFYYTSGTTTSCTTLPSWKNFPAYFVEMPWL